MKAQYGTYSVVNIEELDKEEYQTYKTEIETNYASIINEIKKVIIWDGDVLGIIGKDGNALYYATYSSKIETIEYYYRTTVDLSSFDLTQVTTEYK